MRSYFEKLLAIGVVIVIVGAPLLLIIDFQRYLPFVFFVWAIVALFYVVTHIRRRDRS